MAKRATNHPGLFGDDTRTTRAPVMVSARPDGWVPTPLPELNGETHLCADFETGCEDRPGADARKWWDGAFPVGLAWYLPQSGRRGYTGVRHTDGNATDPATLASGWMSASSSSCTVKRSVSPYSSRCS